MKILLLGEYSNVHWTLGKGLRQLGHQVTVVSNGDFWKDYPRDIDVSRPPGRWGGALLMARLHALLPRLRGYDIVQLINPLFFEVKAERIFHFYRVLRQHNGALVLGAFGMDHYWVSVNTYEKPLRYSDFNLGDAVRTDECALKEQREWLGTAKEGLNRLIAIDCDAIVTGLYEYHATYSPRFPGKTRFIPFPIDLPPAPLQPAAGPAVPGPLRIFVGISRGRSAYKGTDIMLRAARAVEAKYPGRLELRVANGVPFEEYQHLMDGSDAILDQLYSYTPSMNSLLAMSKGIICIGGGEPENYDILGETKLRPVVNVLPTYESVFAEIERLVLHPELVPVLKQQSIAYVRRHHDYTKVARQYEQLYLTLSSGATRAARPGACRG